MEFALLIPTDRSFSSKPPTFYDFFNDPPKPCTELASSSSGSVIDHEGDDPLLKMSLWSYGSSLSSSESVIDHEDDDPLLKMSLWSYGSSLSSSSSSVKKRRQTQSPSSSLYPPPPSKKMKNRTTVLLDPKETTVRLNIGNPDRFTIKKTLEASDVNNLARLMLAKDAVERHVLAHWDEAMKQRLRDREGVEVEVWDSDRNVAHHMTMKIWGGNGSVVLNNRWILKFVRPRGLRRGDQIGLYWDRPNCRLVFSVLWQAPIAAVPISFRRPTDH